MSASGHYDQNLLTAAPKATKQQLQEGYATDLLDRPRPVTSPSPAPPSRGPTDPELGNLVPKEEESSGRASTPAPTRAVPFWRTKKGIIILVVLSIAVLAAIIGGAVGGTAHKSSKPASDSAGSTSGDGTGNIGNGSSGNGHSNGTTSGSSTTGRSSQAIPGTGTEGVGQGQPTPAPPSNPSGAPAPISPPATTTAPSLIQGISLLKRAVP